LGGETVSDETPTNLISERRLSPFLLHFKGLKAFPEKERNETKKSEECLR